MHMGEKVSEQELGVRDRQREKGPPRELSRKNKRKLPQEKAGTRKDGHEGTIQSASVRRA